MCNGEENKLEYFTNGWGEYVPGLILAKNPYGLHVNLNYDIWSNAGYGEDRRRIETEVTSVDDTSYTWLCNAAHQGKNKQALIMKYRVTAEDPTKGDPERTGSGTSGAASAGIGLVLLITATAMMHLNL